MGYARDIEKSCFVKRYVLCFNENKIICHMFLLFSMWMTRGTNKLTVLFTLLSHCSAGV